MEHDDNYACELEMEGGYHGRPYPQKFVRAPLSQHPSKSPRQEMRDGMNAMRVTMGE